MKPGKCCGQKSSAEGAIWEGTIVSGGLFIKNWMTAGLLVPRIFVLGDGGLIHSQS